MVDELQRGAIYERKHDGCLRFLTAISENGRFCSGHTFNPIYGKGTFHSPTLEFISNTSRMMPYSEIPFQAMEAFGIRIAFDPAQLAT